MIELREVFSDPNLNVYLFGSRKDQTGSIRSDVDLLVELPGRASQMQMDAIWKLEPYLDVFALDRGVACSLVNESELRAESNEQLIEKLGAVCLMRGGDWQEEASAFRAQTVMSERSPAATLVQLYDLEDAVPAERADLLVVTALTEEYHAVLDALKIRVCDSPLTGTVLDAKGSPWKLRILNLNEMGSVGAALKTAEALRRTKAPHVVLVGICGGIPGRSKVLDVIVPHSVIYYEPGKVTSEGLKSGFDSRRCDEEIRKRMSEIEWWRRGSTVRAEGELMACGEKVIADADARDRLCESHRKLAAIDMEPYGVLRAAEMRNARVTIIKSVCDLADKNKDDDYHRRAREAAARVLAAAIKDGVFRAVKWGPSVGLMGERGLWC